jgi:hypothetical protein
MESCSMIQAVTVSLARGFALNWPLRGESSAVLGLMVVSVLSLRVP